MRRKSWFGWHDRETLLDETPEKGDLKVTNDSAYCLKGNFNSMRNRNTHLSIFNICDMYHWWFRRSRHSE